MIILFGGEKGGVGKTTLALNLAVLRAAAGRDVVAVDADKQGSLNLWASIRQEQQRKPAVACLQKLGPGLGASVRDLATRYEDVIIDAGGRDSAELRAGLTVAELAILPLQASLFDAATLETLDQLVVTARGFNPELVAAVLINRASPNPRVSESEEARDLVSSYGSLALFTPVIRDRIVYRKSAKDGLAVSEYQPRDPAANAEMNKLYEEVFGDA